MFARVAVILCLFALAVVALRPAADTHTQFRQYMDRFNKSYATQTEYAYRLSVFQQNMQRARELNELHRGEATFGATQFADLTPAEFKAKYLMKSMPTLPPIDRSRVAVPKPLVGDIPTNFDWGLNKTGIVSAVKNQGQCGACWAFSATEAIESAWAAKHSLVSLAPQQIVDCDSTDGGCNGGWPMTAYAYVEKAGGLEPETDYPYKGVDGSCTFNSKDAVAKISGWSYVITSPNQENTTLLNYIASTAPASICVYAEPWQLYNGGIITKGCSNQKSMIDHCVQLTGFGTSDGTPYWRIRNSWGTNWGEEGYIRVKRGSDLCCVAQVVTNPTSL